ncbi:MAG: PD40 domain-containing protein, partial [Opitutaceae bacterium]|nr:PD40 domain-containing protein [Opitutaceae bacterium]
MTALTSVLRAAPTGRIVLELREWEGTYRSRDVPGGVERTPVRSTLWSVRPDGTDRRAIAAAGERAGHPLGSPDGQWLYWQSESAGRWTIWRARPDGSAATVIGPAAGLEGAGQSAFGACLSADGAHLTYTVHDGTTGRTVRAAADGSGARVLAPQFGYLYMACPQPGTDRVVCSGPAQGYRLMLLDGPDAEPRVLTPDHPDCYAPQFTPDGQVIVFIRRDGGLYRIAPDGTGLRRLASGLAIEFRLSPEDAHGSTDFPAISPDGRQVAFVAGNEAAAAQVCVIDLATGNRRQLTQLSGPCARVHWSPDGRWLAFVAMVDSRPQLHVIPADGSAPERAVTAEAGAVYALTWLPD